MKVHAMWRKPIPKICQLCLRDDGSELVACLTQDAGGTLEYSAVNVVMDYKGIIIPMLYLCLNEFDFFHHGVHCKLIKIYGKGFSLCLFVCFNCKALLYMYAYINLCNKSKRVGGVCFVF